MARSQILKEDLKHFKLPITENQLKMLLVLIENLEDLERHRLLELSDEEKLHFGTIYDHALKLLEEIETPRKNNNYADQVEHLCKKIKNHSSNKETK